MKFMELVLDLDKFFSKQFLDSDFKELLKNEKIRFNKDVINNVEKEHYSIQIIKVYRFDKLEGSSTFEHVATLLKIKYKEDQEKDINFLIYHKPLFEQWYKHFHLKNDKKQINFLFKNEKWIETEKKCPFFSCYNLKDYISKFDNGIIFNTYAPDLFFNRYQLEKLQEAFLSLFEETKTEVNLKQYNEFIMDFIKFFNNFIKTYSNQDVIEKYYFKTIEMTLNQYKKEMENLI